MTPFGYAAPGGGNFGRSSQGGGGGGGGVDLGESCWQIETHCQAIIETKACAPGFCHFGANISITKVRMGWRINTPSIGCEGCNEGPLAPQFTYNKTTCPFWTGEVSQMGTKVEALCKRPEIICAVTPGPLWRQKLDFNCGPGALGSRGAEQKKLAARLEECLKKVAGSGDESDEKQCETLCDLTNITNPPGGGPDGTPGGIGNKQMCAPPPFPPGTPPQIINSPLAQGQPFAYFQQEHCEDKLSAEFMKALGEWLDKNCK